jgi:hypothetical protein
MLMLTTTIAKGLVGGAIGTAAMTIGENLEQRATGRADSYVPARTAGRLLRLREPDSEALGRNLAMHWGTGIVGGAARALLSERGFRGLPASATHLVLRFTTDQMLENVAGVSSPPWTWPRFEVTIDLFHKATYSLVTGALIDALIRPR